MSTTGGPVGGAALDLSPAPGAAPVGRMLAAQTRTELRLMLRNGEQVLLTLGIPVVLLVALATVGVVDLGPGERVDVVAPGVLALAVMSTAFTGQAIGTGFDRRYGVLKLLGATPLPRWGLVAAKTLAVLALEVVQVALLAGVALALGWSPAGGFGSAAVLLVAGTAAFSALGLALAGVLRAEATLAVANGIYLLLLLGGGTVVPLDRLPSGFAAAVQWLPSAALGEGLRAVLRDGAGLPVGQVLVLLAWAAAGTAVAARTFRWE